MFVVGETGDETLEDGSRVLRKEGGAGEERNSLAEDAHHRENGVDERVGKVVYHVGGLDGARGEFLDVVAEEGHGIQPTTHIGTIAEICHGL